jgi:hypothetical protein
MREGNERGGRRQGQRSVSEKTISSSPRGRGSKLDKRRLGRRVFDESGLLNLLNRSEINEKVRKRCLARPRAGARIYTALRVSLHRRRFLKGNGMEKS